MKLSIVQYGDPVLRAKGRLVEKIDSDVRQLAQDMIETMHAANGVGLAAQQVSQAVQLTVLDISEVEDRPSTLKLNGRDVDPKGIMPLILINPKIELGREIEMGTEGCLSFPEITGEIERAKSIVARDCWFFGPRHPA
jgi:peptide deformylase